MEKRDLIYEGKAKKLYRTDDENVLWVEYMNQATALNGLKKDTIAGKGALNNQITSLIFEKLQEKGIPSHFIKKLSKTEQLVEHVEIIPLEVVVRNYAAGSFSKRLGVVEGKKLAQPIVEFYYKDDALADPFINDEIALVLGIATLEELAELKFLAKTINGLLIHLFAEKNVTLIDFKLEFGKDKNGKIILADEISPDTCRLWDAKSHDHLDKDVFRRDLGDLIPVYEEILQRLEK